jgi:hypothetical protein
MYGPWSVQRTVHIPEVMAGEIDADEAWYRMQYGSLVDDSVLMPTGITDTNIDSGSATTAYNTSSTLDVGRSFFSSSTSQRASSLISFDMSPLPLPATLEIINASLEMTTTGTSVGSGVHVSRVWHERGMERQRDVVWSRNRRPMGHARWLPEQH